MCVRGKVPRFLRLCLLEAVFLRFRVAAVLGFHRGFPVLFGCLVSFHSGFERSLGCRAILPSQSLRLRVLRLRGREGLWACIIELVAAFVLGVLVFVMGRRYLVLQVVLPSRCGGLRLLRFVWNLFLGEGLGMVVMELSSGFDGSFFAVGRQAKRFFMFSYNVVLAVAMKDTFWVGVRGTFISFPLGVSIMAPASFIMRWAAAMSVTLSLPRMSMKASVVPSAT